MWCRERWRLKASQDIFMFPSKMLNLGMTHLFKAFKYPLTTWWGVALLATIKTGPLSGSGRLSVDFLIKTHIYREILRGGEIKERC